MLSLFVIEDDDVDFLAVERALKKANSSALITRARDGHEALAMLEQEVISKPTVLVVDLQMPKMNGIEFLYHLRKSARYHDSVVIVLSTSNDPGDVFDCYRSQIAAYFEKSQLGSNYEPLIQLLNLYENHVTLPSEYL